MHFVLCANNAKDGCDCAPTGVTRPCYAGKAGTEGNGTCRPGTRTCNNGRWSSCSGEVLPSSERCNGIDDDCDGRIDDGVTGPKRKEYFLAFDGSKADYLFVIDNSQSMNSERRDLAQASSAFLSQLQQLKADYHVGVIMQETRANGHLVGSPPFLTSQTTNAASLLAGNIQNGTGSGFAQRAFAAAQEALSPPASTNQNAGFLRQDATLVLIFVSPLAAPTTFDSLTR